MAEDDGPRFVKALGVESQSSETEDSGSEDSNLEAAVEDAVDDLNDGDAPTTEDEVEEIKKEVAQDEEVQKEREESNFTNQEIETIVDLELTRHSVEKRKFIITSGENKDKEIVVDSVDSSDKGELIFTFYFVDDKDKGTVTEQGNYMSFLQDKDFAEYEDLFDDDVDSDKEPKDKEEPEYQSFAGNSEDREYKLLSKSYNSNHRTKPDANFEKDLSIFSNFIGPYVAERFLKEGPLRQITKLAQHGHLVGLGGQDGSKITAAYKKLPGSEKQAVDRMISAITGKNSTKYMTYITKNIKKEAKFKPGDTVGRTEDGVDIKYDPNAIRQMQEQLETIIEHYINQGKL